MPRSTALTKELQAKIVEYLGAGVTIRDTCLQCGVGEATFHKWMRWGDDEYEPSPSADKPPKDRTKYRAFRQAVMVAQTNLATAVTLQLARKVRTGDLSASECVKVLERLRGDTWKRKDQVTVSGDPAAPVVQRIEFSAPHIAQAEALASAVGLDNVVPMPVPTKSKRAPRKKA